MDLQKLEDKNISRAAALVARLNKQAESLQMQIHKAHNELKEVNKDLAAAKEYLEDLTKAKND